MDPLESRLIELIAKTNLTVTDKQISQLVGYVKLLDKWNHAYNLTSVRDPNDMLVRHILDSIVISPFLQGSEDRRGQRRQRNREVKIEGDKEEREAVEGETSRKM